ncbi:hypothetical protein [Cyanobacterium aponinum]|uniref:TIGR04255 family protein n=1 Tax=Cyanobacterium aponinum 0216 TaxID=2676140 RepID=A0A844GMM8_9CHRO|nr:hypothetical protein [Cyanobacterium aponinum]MTF37844.1 hypothetical protein [Cyanobacterium aponinum 0216]
METTSNIQTQPQGTPVLQDIEELTISLVIKNFNPTLLSYEFLTMSGIVPNTWELARQPVVNPRASQISFKNGVNIVAQGNSLSFIEGLGNKEVSQLQFAKVAQLYVEKMPNAEYQGLSISPKVIIPFGEGEEEGKNFINDTFLNTGSWRNFGNTTPQASLNLFYQLDKCRLTVNINPARLQQPNNVAISAVLFAGSFNYLLGENPVASLTSQINQWEADLTTFRELVYQQILQKAPKTNVSLFDN